ncbi:MAG: omptin family outer membrane protease [Pseudomonadota bacterium]
MTTQFVPLLMGTLFSVGAVADSIVTADNKFELRLSSGVLNGESGEYVYDAYGAYTGIPGYKISELQWKLNDVYMLGIGATLPIGDRVDINLDYWKNATEGDGTMDDYDWLYVGEDWSHWSHHEDTVVRDVTLFDLSADITFHRFKDRNASLYQTALFGIVGYKQDHFDWQSSGGYGVYSVDSFRDTYLTFPNIPGISYEQTFKTPYIGLGVESASNYNGMDLILNANVRYSQWAKGEDVDIHHLRSLRFEEEGDDGEWLGYEITMEFEIARQLTLMFGYNYQKYDEIKATTVVTDQITGAKYYYPGDSAGLDHSSDMMTLEMNYRF